MLHAESAIRQRLKQHVARGVGQQMERETMTACDLRDCALVCELHDLSDFWEYAVIFC